MLTKLNNGEYLESGDRHSLEEWEALGNPIVWRSVEIFNEWEVRIDIAYGRIQLLKNGKPISTGKWNCATLDGKVLAMDRDYYGLPGYLYFKANIK